MQVNGPEWQKLARKKSLAVSVACMAIYCPIPGFKGRNLKLCVLIGFGLLFLRPQLPTAGCCLDADPQKFNER